MLHLTKIAYGCVAIGDLDDWIADEAADGEVTITTRHAPKRADELVGGSLFWILKHRLIARQRIVGLVEPEEGSNRWRIRLEARLVRVAPLPRRAHQGWRYLADADAPRDLDEIGDGQDLPPELAAELASLGLL